MKRHYMYSALGLLLLVNIVVLFGVARNRSGLPDATLTLTERELPLSWDFRDRENTGVCLRLNVNFDSEELQWFNENKVADLGFDIPPDTVAGRGFSKRVLPKKAYVVLEYDGPAWQRYRQRRLDEIAALSVKAAQGQLESDSVENQVKERRFQLRVASRLFSVDVGLDPEALRVRYPDRGRYIVLPAQVRLHVDRRPETSDTKGIRSVSGRVERILVDQLHVTRNFTHGLQTLQEHARIQPGYTYFTPEEPARNRYQVQVAFGRRLEPWILGIEIFRPE